MSATVQEFLAASARQAANDLVTALLRVPEDKRDWSPMGNARTALDQVAECALLTGSTAEMLVTRKFPDFKSDEYDKARAELIADWSKMEALLKENTEKAAAEILKIPDEDFDTEIVMPWGPMKLVSIMAYPYWNMTYHEAQINYIASMLGCL